MRNRLFVVMIALGLATGACAPAPVTGSTPSTPTIVTTTGDASTTSAPVNGATTMVPPTHVGFLLVMGDWGSGTESEGAIAGAMERFTEDNQVAAIATTGDNFYTDDIDFLMQPFDWVDARGIPFWLSWGNHDVTSEERIEAIEARFEAPRWVTRQWGETDVIILDSNQVSSEAQRQFLMDEMARSDRPTIVLFHAPPYSCSTHGDTDAIVDGWLPIFDEDVFLVLSGHDHNYQRFEVDDRTYVVTGGGGRTLYDAGQCPAGHSEQLAASTTHHFLALTQVGETIEVRALDLLGEPIDSFVVEIPG